MSVAYIELILLGIARCEISVGAEYYSKANFTWWHILLGGKYRSVINIAQRKLSLSGSGSDLAISFRHIPQLSYGHIGMCRWLM